jgi:hypothetical protein
MVVAAVGRAGGTANTPREAVFLEQPHLMDVFIIVITVPAIQKMPVDDGYLRCALAANG